ncbi:hypothetical protein D3C86_1894550 [compost metagenome]
MPKCRVRPPTRQPSPDRGGPERVEALGQMMAENPATAEPATFDQRAINGEMRIPVTVFIKSDGLFVASAAAAAQAPK